MTRNPNAAVRAAKTAREVRDWRNTDAAQRAAAKSGWCSAGQHDGCQRRPAVALRCPCTCHEREDHQ